MVAPPESPTPEPDPYDSAPSEEAEAFATRVDDALFALEDLPGYSYTVSDPSYYPGLVLRGRVASIDRRDWTLHVAGKPEQVVARWVLAGGQAYADVTGRWEKLERLPFERDAPIAFALGDVNLLYDPYGEVDDTRRSRERIAARAVTRYDIDQDYGEDLGTATQSVWVAEEGGYLLRFLGLSWFGGPGADPLTINVTPLKEAPKISVPEPGASVFEGDPPLWRASLLGQERLRGLESYAFKVSDRTEGAEVEVQGRVSSDRGALSGRVPAYASAEQAGDRDTVESLKVELRYIGARVWARVEGQRWRRIPTRASEIGPREADILSLLLYVPGGPPEDLLDEEFLQDFNASQFGVNRWTVLPALVEGKQAGSAELRGRRTLHYMGSLDPYSAEPAEVWLAAEGHHLIQAVAEESWRHGELRLEVHDVNKPFTVAPPAR